MQAQSSVRTSGLNLSTAMERLSSGVRINSARDDAAGLAISTRMTASIRGISAAIRNANDGISLTQTAEGSLGQIGDNLQRIRELAVQSANTGNNSSDRAALNNEATQLIAEIDRVASNTTFNGIKLLDGSFQNQALQVGAGNDANDRITISVGSAKSSSLGVGSSSSYSTSVVGAATGATALTSGALAINGFSVGPAVADGVSSTASTTSGIAVAAAINGISGQTGVTATASATTNTGAGVTISATTVAANSTAAAFATDIVAGDLKINGVDIGAIARGTNAATQGAAVTAAINAKTSLTGVVATNDSGKVSLAAADGRSITVVSASTAVPANTGLLADATTNSTSGFRTALVAGDVKINGVDIGAVAIGNSAGERGSQMAAAINSKSSQTGVTATFNTSTGAVTLNAADGRNIEVATTANATVGRTGLLTAHSTTAVYRSSVSLASSSSAGITIADVAGTGASASGLTTSTNLATATAGAGVSSLNLTTATGSQEALTTLDLAINTITNSRAAMGAYQNRLTASIANLETTSMNLSASRSRILDTDYAKETTNLAKSQIIQQAATAMLAQANQSGQSVLALLK